MSIGVRMAMKKNVGEDRRFRGGPMHEVICDLSDVIAMDDEGVVIAIYVSHRAA